MLKFTTGYQFRGDKNMANSLGFEAILYEMWHEVTLKTGKLLNADRAIVFLLDRKNNELWSIVASADHGRFVEIRMPAGVEILGEVVASNRIVNIPFDFYDDPQSSAIKEQDLKTGYRTYTVMALPLFSEEGDLMAVVQLFNKLKATDDIAAPLSKRVDTAGFTKSDEDLFTDFVPLMRPILEKCQTADAQAIELATPNTESFLPSTADLNQARTEEIVKDLGEDAWESSDSNQLLLNTQNNLLGIESILEQQQISTVLMSAIRSLSQSSLDLDETIQGVMNEAKNLMGADRGTVWLVEREKNELWTKIPMGGTLKEIRIPMWVGFVGEVVQSGEPLVIGFDLYEHPDTETVKQTDRKVGYRTCSLLCVPIFNANGVLIGVTQLVNKQQPGDFPDYDPDDWPNAPDCWQASYNRSDQEVLQAFNIKAGIVLQNAMKFAALKRQQQIEHDIIRTLPYGVISTDKTGTIIALNERAKNLLGFRKEEELEGRLACDLIQFQNSNFTKLFQAAIEAKYERDCQQFYPNQILLAGDEQHIINLSISSIADAGEPTNIYGVLVVMDNMSDEKHLKTQLYQYMTPELVEQLLDNPQNRLASGSPLSPIPSTQITVADNLLTLQTIRERKDISVLFSGIRSFTPLLENLEDQEVNQLLKEYFESMTEAVFKNKGTIDKYVGDAIIALFGWSLPLEDHAWCAVQTAVEMRYRLVELNVRRVEDGKPAIRIGIGINSDSLQANNIGATNRLEFSSRGDGVNLGSQLEKASKEYGCDIIISETTYQPCAEQIWARELDLIRIDGTDKPVAIYQLAGLRSEEIPEEKLQVLEYYSQGREYYRSHQFVKAIAAFTKVLEISSWDKPAAIQIERCQHWLHTPPPADWDGVWRLTDLT
ncbi:GAF domain-containing protein [Microcoleus sp. FACHB-672]|uniref:GAF domain-containing protein n=1 Tax=Microcoleus sp. FACHB-672 TaxID=2692825 RepID=UPI001685FA5C|nr:GAF domain-containing protein [Microcoleus sp. FACHB-672]MBD2039844.1 GAF domain-containing protein [Microcoleus sp. FACHB-672]